MERHQAKVTKVIFMLHEYDTECCSTIQVSLPFQNPLSGLCHVTLPNPLVPLCMDWVSLCMNPPAQADVEVSAEGGMCSLFPAQHLCESGRSCQWERVGMALAGKVWVGGVNSVWVVGRLGN